jgi:ribosomal protein S18 acetylase RimI-like enzyme
MDEEQKIVIRPLTAKLIEAAVRIHEESLGHTFNSSLGTEHLRFLYRAMCADRACYVGVALDGDRPVGVVSGTLDAQGLRSRLIKSISARRAAGLALGLLARPRLIFQLWQSSAVAGPIQIGMRDVAAILTAIAVEPRFQGHGIGKQLIGALESFFSERGIRQYRLDTLIDNATASKFYQSLGFRPIEKRAGSTVFVKEI